MGKFEYLASWFTEVGDVELMSVNILVDSFQSQAKGLH